MTKKHIVNDLCVKVIMVGLFAELFVFINSHRETIPLIERSGLSHRGLAAHSVRAAHKDAGSVTEMLGLSQRGKASMKRGLKKVLEIKS